MFCPYCGTHIADDALFCQHCGKHVTKPQDMEPERSAGTNVPEPPQANKPSPVPASPGAGGAMPQSAAVLPASIAGLATKTSVGPLIAAGGGLLAVLAFFFLPYLSLGFLGSLTGVQVASISNRYLQSTGILGLEPIVAAAAFGIAVYLIVKGQKQEIDQQVAKGLAMTLIVLSGITVLIVFIKYIVDLQPAIQMPSGAAGPALASFYGAGIWIYFLGMLAVLIGGFIHVRALAKTK